MFRWLGIFLVVTIAACANGAGADRASAPARPSHAEATVSPGAALMAALPETVFGHGLRKVIVTSEATGRAGWLRDLMVELGRAPSDLAVAMAYDPEFPDLRILAVGVRGISADRLVGAYVAVTARDFGDLHPQAREFGGKHAVCFSLSPASPMNSCVGTRADMLFVVTSSEFVHITEAIKAIL